MSHPIKTHYAICKLLLLLAFTACSCSGQEQSAAASGTAIHASSPSLQDVQEAVDQAMEGDTVLIPEGEAVWPSSLMIDKALTLKGAGAEKTLLVNG